MAVNSTDLYSVGPGGTVASGNVSLDHTRRVFNFGDRIAELAPAQSPFFVYLSKVGKKPTNDPVFKFLEQRHQWQRRHFQVNGAKTSSAHGGDDTNFNIANLVLDCDIDSYGRTAAGSAPDFIQAGNMVVIEGLYDADDGNFDGDEVPVEAYFKVGTKDSSTQYDMTFVKAVYKNTKGANATTVAATTSGVVTEGGSSKLRLADNADGMVIGSSWAEGTLAPTGWRDELYDREGYCQIFKTAIETFSGTTLATEYRGIPNEFRRVWTEKLMEHKMDLERAMLMGVGKASESGTPERHTWGIMPYTQAYGKNYVLDYSANGYDQFIDIAEDLFHPESGNTGSKLMLASRKVISWMNKLAASNFLGNTVGTSQYRLDVANVPGAFGHTVTKVNTIFGDFHLVQEPLLKGVYEDYAVIVDMKNVAYRPLAGNGQSRDTQIKTNIQSPDLDGRKDMILTEAGLEISLPETHAVITMQA